MLKLTESQINRKRDLIIALERNAEQYISALNHLNASIDIMSSWIEEITADMSNYQLSQERSIPGWADTDFGTKYQEWLDTFYQVPLDQINDSGIADSIISLRKLVNAPAPTH